MQVLGKWQDSVEQSRHEKDGPGACFLLDHPLVVQLGSTMNHCTYQRGRCWH